MSEITEIELLLRDISERLNLQQQELTVRLRKIRGLEKMYADLLQEHHRRCEERDAALKALDEITSSAAVCHDYDMARLYELEDQALQARRRLLNP